MTPAATAGSAFNALKIPSRPKYAKQAKPAARPITPAEMRRPRLANGLGQGVTAKHGMRVRIS